MLLFFLLSGNLGTVLTFAGLVLGLWVFAYCFAHIPPKMRCYEGDVRKKKIFLPSNDKFYNRMMKMKDGDKFEIFVNRDDVNSLSKKKLAFMLISGDATKEEVTKKYPLQSLALNKRLYRITHTETGKRWVVHLDDSDIYKVKYTMHYGD